MARKGFYFDATRCVDCKTCQVACKKKNNLTKGVEYRYMNNYEVGEYPTAKLYHFSYSCNHCENPACVEGCPTGAMYKNEEDGTVQHDDDRCIGCKVCTMVCPYNIPVYLEDKGITGKCNACIDTRPEDGTPTCVAACPMRALEFGDFEELQAKHPDAVIEVACRPSPEITNPSTLIQARDYMQDKNYEEVVL